MALAKRTYHIGLAIISLDGLFQAPLASALRRTWEPGVSVNRRGRRWTLTNMHLDTAELVTGEIGFVSETAVESTSFDEKLGEFVSESLPGGARIPFAIRLEDGLVAYQVRPGFVSEASFTGALQSLFNASVDEFIWQVEPAAFTRSWEEWREGIQAITSINIRVERPNPNYHQNVEVERLVEEIRSEYVRLVAEARDAEGLDGSSDLFQQAIDHVLREYGNASVRGIDDAGGESVWSKVKGAYASVSERRIVKTVGESEIAEDELVSVLQSGVGIGTVQVMHAGKDGE